MATTTMTRREAIERLTTAAEDDPDLESEAAELFTAIYGRTPDADDGDAGELISMCYAGAKDETSDDDATETQAEQIAARYDHDGQRGVDEIGEACLAAGATREVDERRETVRYGFRDGSAIIVQCGAAWDLGIQGSTCHCWAGAGHEDGCSEGGESGTTTIRLDDSITSHDETITLPHSITLHEDGRADAVHVDSADVEYSSLAALCEAYGIDEDEVKAIGEPVREYVWTTDAATWGTEPITDGDHRRLCQLAEDYLTEHEGDALSISVRRTRSGEIAGTYEVRPNGNLQILGASIAVPEDVRDLTNRAWEHALKAASAPRRWVLHEDSGATETIEAATLAEAVEQLREWIAGGEYEITSTVWTDGWVHAEDDPDERESVTVEIDPEEPDCVDGHTHDWHEVSVRGHGGGVISTDECRHCGAKRITDTWAQNPSTGEQGLHSVSYERANRA